MLDVQQAQPSSDCGKSNLPTVNVQGLSSVYSAPVVDLKYQRWYNVEKQLAQPSSDCGKIYFPTVNVQGPLSV